MTEGAYIRISGGDVKINASGDGIDSNGDLYLEGGTVLVEGPAGGGDGALDYDGEDPYQGEPYWLWEARECSGHFPRNHPNPCWWYTLMKFRLPDQLYQ